MTTSKPSRLVFFKKDGCGPCEKATEALDQVLELNPEYGQYVSVIQKENAPALVAAYELKMYPTVLIMDKESHELSRKVGSSFLTKDWWNQALDVIANQ
jgi:thiol-disulfide isomerase/thioredoxin